MEENELADAIRETLISPNVPDSNLEPSNVVDVIAGAGLNVSRALSNPAKGATVTDGLFAIASAISELARAVRNK